MKLKHYMHALFGFMALSLGLCNAQASTVYTEFQVVSGTNVSSSTEIHQVQAGAYKASLADFEYPEAFDVLSLGILQGNNELGVTFGTDFFTFNVPSTGTIIALLTGKTGSMNKGAYAFEITAIPLPPALLLFSSALFGLVVVGRREHRSGAS